MLFNNLMLEDMPVAMGGSTGSIEPPLSQVEPPKPGPKVFFLNLHACHRMWNLSFYTFDIAKNSIF